MGLYTYSIYRLPLPIGYGTFLMFHHHPLQLLLVDWHPTSYAAVDPKYKLCITTPIELCPSYQHDEILLLQCAGTQYKKRENILDHDIIKQYSCDVWSVKIMGTSCFIHNLQLCANWLVASYHL